MKWIIFRNPQNTSNVLDFWLRILFNEACHFSFERKILIGVYFFRILRYFIAYTYVYIYTTKTSILTPWIKVGYGSLSNKSQMSWLFIIIYNYYVFIINYMWQQYSTCQIYEAPKFSGSKKVLGESNIIWVNSTIECKHASIKV